MTTPEIQTNASEPGIVISVDAMGGDRGPAAVVAGMALSVVKIRTSGLSCMATRRC